MHMCVHENNEINSFPHFKMMQDPEAVVYGIDHIRGILKFAKQNIAKSHRDVLESGKIVLLEADGREGLADYAPFDVRSKTSLFLFYIMKYKGLV